MHAALLTSTRDSDISGATLKGAVEVLSNPDFGFQHSEYSPLSDGAH